MFLVSTSSEIKESSGVMAMSPVGWLSICCRRSSDCSSWLVQSWHASSMPSPSPPYSGGKTGGEKKSLRVSWKSAPCRCIYSHGKRSMSLVLWERHHAMWYSGCETTRLLTLSLILSDRKGRIMAKTGRKNIGSLIRWIPLTFSGNES